MGVKPNDPSKCRLSVYLYSPDKKCIRRRTHLKNYCADKNIDLHIFDSVRFFYNPSLMISAKKLNDLKQIKDWNHNETRKIDDIPNYDDMEVEECIIEKQPYFEEISINKSPSFEESNLGESSISKHPIIEEPALEKYSNESTIRESIIGESSFDGIDSLIDEFTIEDSSTFEKFPVDESSSSILESNFEKSNEEKSIIEESAIIR